MDTPGSDDEDVMPFVEAIEERWDREWLYETDKVWDAIHRCLTDGKLEYGRSPLHLCVLAHDNICEDEDYAVCVAEADEVKQVVVAISGIDEAELRRRYDTFDFEAYDGTKSDDDFRYTWENFAPLREFFTKAAADNRAMMFTASS